MKKILITAFEPFGKISTNSSLEVLNKLVLNLPDIKIVKKILPVLYDPSLYATLLKDEKPDIIILCGQAEGRKWVMPELSALNYCYSKAGDNAKVIKLGEKIISDGPNAYFSKLKVLEVVNHLKRRQYPIELSLHAGGFVCNYAYYLMSHFALERQKCLFVHFPLFEGQIEDKNIPSLKLEDMVDTLVAIIYEILAIK